MIDKILEKYEARIVSVAPTWGWELGVRRGSGKVAYQPVLALAAVEPGVGPDPAWSDLWCAYVGAIGELLVASTHDPEFGTAGLRRSRESTEVNAERALRKVSRLIKKQRPQEKRRRS